MDPLTAMSQMRPTQALSPNQWNNSASTWNWRGP
jgi:hypothetical protein